MPPELLELYQLYQQEVASRNEKEANYLTELNVMLRVGGVCGVKGGNVLTIFHPAVALHVVTARPRVRGERREGGEAAAHQT